MPNIKNDVSGSHASMSEKQDREMGHLGKNPAPGTGGRKAAPHDDADADQVTTSGGSKGNFSDKDRASEDKWSPGSSQPSDQ